MKKTRTLGGWEMGGGGGGGVEVLKRLWLWPRNRADCGWMPKLTEKGFSCANILYNYWKIGKLQGEYPKFWSLNESHIFFFAFLCFIFNILFFYTKFQFTLLGFNITLRKRVSTTFVSLMSKFIHSNVPKKKKRYLTERVILSCWNGFKLWDTHHLMIFQI